MAHKKSPPPSDNKSKGRRPTATIDLKATDVTEKAPEKLQEKLSAKGAVKSAQPEKAQEKATDKSPDKSKGKTGAASRPDIKKNAPQSGKGTAPPRRPATATASEAKKGTSGSDSSGGFAGHMISGLAGGAMALLGTLGYQSFQSDSRINQVSGNNTPSTQITEIREITEITDDLKAELTSELSVRINSLEERLNALPETTAAPVPSGSSGASNGQQDLGEIKTALENIEITNAELRARTTTAEKKLSSLSTQDIPDEIKGRLKRFEETIAAMAGAANDPGQSNVAEIAALVGRINDFEGMLDAKVSDLRKSISEEMKSETQTSTASTSLAAIEALKAENKQLGLTMDEIKGGLTHDIKNTEKTIADVKSTSQSLQDKISSAATDLKALSTRFDTMQSGMSDREKLLAKTDTVKAEMAAVTTRLDAFSSKLEGINSREETSRKNAANVHLSLELANLKRAVANGQPYTTELNEIGRIAGDSIDLSALEKYKDQTVLSEIALTNSFRNIANDILSSTTGSQKGTVLDAILSSARSVVRVRKTGDIKGTTSEAILARMETRLKAGDLNGVLAESKSLTEPHQKIATIWLQQIEARNAIDRSLQKLEQHFKSSLKSLNGGQAQ